MWLQKRPIPCPQLKGCGKFQGQVGRVSNAINNFLYLSFFSKFFRLREKTVKQMLVDDKCNKTCYMYMCSLLRRVLPLTTGQPLYEIVPRAKLNHDINTYRIKQSKFKAWPGTSCCVLGQDTLLSQCLSPPRCINGYRQISCWG